MIAAGKGPAQYVLMLGFSGWGPGQLEDELADNAWLTVPADNELLFQVPLDLRWQTATARQGVDPGQLGIGRAHVLTPVTNEHLVCRLPLEKTIAQRRGHRKRKSLKSSHKCSSHMPSSA